MANVAVAVVAGAAGAIAGKVMSNGKGGKGDDEDVDFAPDGRANANHEVEAKKSRYLAQEYPKVDERDEKTPDNWVKRHPGLYSTHGETPVQRRGVAARTHRLRVHLAREFTHRS